MLETFIIKVAKQITMIKKRKNHLYILTTFIYLFKKKKENTITIYI